MLKRRVLRTLTVIGLLIPVGFAGLWYGLSPPGLRLPVRLVRDADGKLVEDPPPESSGFEVHAGTLKANNTLSCGSSTSSGDVAKFAARRLVIFGLSDHVLMQRVARDLLDELKKLDGVEEIRFLPPGHADELGTLAPDMFVTLELTKITESGLLANELDAEVRMTACDRLARSNYSLINNLTPPTLSYMSTADLKHQSRVAGIHSSAAKYKLQANDIAKQLAGSLMKQIAEWRTKQGDLPALPESFYPTYAAPPNIPLEGFSALQLASHNGLWKHSETFWRCQVDQGFPAVLAELEKRLIALDWKTDALDTSSSPRLAMQHGDWRLEAFAHSAMVAQQPSKSFYVHVVQPISQQELDAAIARLVDNEAPLETLLLVERHWKSDQQARILQRLSERPSATPQVYLTIANTLDRLGRKDDAKLALRKAQALLFSVNDQADLASKLRSAAKRLGDEKLVDVAADADLLDQLGFLAWPPRANSQDQSPPGATMRQFDADSALLLYQIDQDGKPHTFAARVASSPTQDSYMVATADVRPGVRSWSSGMLVDSQRPAKFHWSPPGGATEIELFKVPDQARLKAKIRSAL